PIVVSHACISGLVALITGMRLLQSGIYDHVVVAGADIITQFILSGFESFHAVSDAPCRPFDARRNGITLGEAAATIILSTQKPRGEDGIQLLGGAVSNDANHISGPSRTGEELNLAIEAAIQEAGINKMSIDFISAHGTATTYNDDMESKAITLSGLQSVPVNSLKGYFGHTLGAAGLIETAACVQSLKENMILPTHGFEEPGTAEPLRVSNVLQKGEYSTCLKTASGFGGCNAAIVLQKAV
ncbi:MAG TPA: beta-ketoacyl synthase N-terminal-like domain-containing protein, partial [Agriterribacter sp.]|nr:beta-ketoacyl synthase N-terminal-like domain-containing protein [Agriterribacter sp.]